MCQTVYNLPLLVLRLPGHQWHSRAFPPGPNVMFPPPAWHQASRNTWLACSYLPFSDGRGRRKPCNHVVSSQKVWKTSPKACRRQVFRLGIRLEPHSYRNVVSPWGMSSFRHQCGEVSLWFPLLGGRTSGESASRHQSSGLRHPCPHLDARVLDSCHTQEVRHRRSREFYDTSLPYHAPWMLLLYDGSFMLFKMPRVRWLHPVLNVSTQSLK